MPIWKQGLFAIIGLAALLYLGSMSWLYLRQERLLFQPEVLAADHRFAVVGSDVVEEKIAVPGAELSALHLRLPHPKGVVFFLHGNGGSLDGWFVNMAFYRQANFDLFMIDYRGYGKSTGRIESEAQLRADVRAAWDAIAPRYAGLQRVIYGRSLGTALAAGLAAELQPELTILVSPYSSMTALMHDHYPLVPGFLLRYPLDTATDAQRIKAPLLLVHGERDPLIAIRHAERIAALVPTAHLLRVADAAHNDVHEFSIYKTALRDALAALPDPPR